MEADTNRTAYAQAAFQFSDIFSFKFGPLRFGDAPARQLVLREPDGPSTAGGRQARQSLVLVPEDGSGGQVVCGWIDVPQKQSELRTHGLLDQQYVQRFGQNFDLDEVTYNGLLEELKGFLTVQKIDFHEVAPDPSVAPPAPRPASSASATAAPQGGLAPGAVAAILTAGVGLGILAAYLLLR